MGIVENLKDLADLAKKVGQIELQKQILEAEEQVRELAREKRQLQDKVDELQRVLHLRKDMKRKGLLYYQDGDSSPYCPTCLEKDERAVHVVPQGTEGTDEWTCNVCKNFYETGPTSGPAFDAIY